MNKALSWAFGILIVLMTLQSALAQYSILAGDKPDIIITRVYSATKCDTKAVCSWQSKTEEAPKTDIPLWNSGSHTLTLKPLYTLASMNYDADQTPKLIISLDGKDTTFKNGDRMKLSQFLEAQVSIQAGIEVFNVYPDCNPKVEQCKPPVSKTELVSVQYAINLYLDPDGNNVLTYAGNPSTQFQKDTKIPFNLQAKSEGLDWAVISTDSGQAFFTGTKVNVVKSLSQSGTKTIDVPITNTELGNRIITAYSSILSRTLNDDGSKQQDDIFTKSATGLEVTIDVKPEVQGTPSIIGTPIQGRSVNTRKMTYFGIESLKRQFSGLGNTTLLLIGIIIIIVIYALKK